MGRVRGAVARGVGARRVVAPTSSMNASLVCATATPLATPAKRRSNSRMIPQRSAHATDMMVICAPESTNALIGCSFTFMST